MLIRGARVVTMASSGAEQAARDLGRSNAGLIESDRETLLVDTLMGLQITRDMLGEMTLKVAVCARIDKLVNTHGGAYGFRNCDPVRC